jgi:WD40 repeat protein
MWVAREIECWLINRPSARLLIGWTAGDLAWNREAGDFDWQNTIPMHSLVSFTKNHSGSTFVGLPPSRRSPPPHLSSNNDYSARRACRWYRPESLVGEDTRQHRIFRRAATAVGAILACLTVVAIALAFFFLRQRNLARDNATKAENNRQEAVRRLVRLNTSNGLQLLDSGDHAGALVWLTEALKLGEENGALQRIRLASLFGDYPQPHVAIFPGCTVLHAEYSPDGRRIATACDDRTARVWDAERGEPVTPLLPHEGLSIGRRSPRTVAVW